MSLQLSIALLCLFHLSSSQNVLVQRGTLEKAIEMMEENDDWMNTLKLMMNNATKGFKVESRRMIEYGGSEPTNDDQEQGGGGGLATMTIHEDVTPMDGPFATNVRRLRPDLPVFRNKPTMIRGSDLVVGDVGVCKTQYKVETLNTATLLRKPNGPKYMLAHPVPVAVGRCRQELPTMRVGSAAGKCVLAAQAHIAWLVVSMDDSKDMENCVDIPGVTALKKCADWIVFGGRCVYDEDM